MNNQTPDTHANTQIARDISREIGQALTHDLHNHVNLALDTLTQQTKTSLTQLAQTAAQAATDAAQAAAAATEQQLAATTSAFEERTHAQVTSLLAAISQHTEASLTQLTQATTEAAAATTAARTATTEAATLKAQAEAAQATAEKATANANKAEANAHKAIQFMTLRGEREIERNLATANLKAKEKRLYDQLKAEKTALEEHHDREDAILERGINHYYPEIAERFQQLLQTQENQENNDTRAETRINTTED